MPGAVLILLLFLSAASTGEDNDLVFENEGPRRLLDNVIEDVQIPIEEDTGIGSRIQRLKNQIFGGFWDFNLFASSTTEEPSFVRRKDEDLFFGDQNNEETKDDHPRVRRAMGDDEVEGSSSGSGDDESPSVFSPGKELTIRVSFVVREPYQEQFSNRDSLPFQNLSRNLADGVNELFDRLPGEQQARLVRIQSRPEDNFTCKVTLELQSTDFYDTDRIQNFLRRHIRETGRLGKVIVSDEEFSYKQFDADVIEPHGECLPDDMRCRNGECVQASRRCDGVIDCSDNSDEMGCDIGSPIEAEIDEDGNGSRQSVPVTESTSSRGFDVRDPTTEDVTAEEETTPATTERPRYSTPSSVPSQPEDYPRCRADDQVRCRDDSAFICKEQLCDGNVDCPNGDDETNCPSESDCQSDEMVCDISRCVLSSKRCDGVPDCIDGADERDCSDFCRPDLDFACNNGKCIDGKRKCDRVMDCSGGEDELNCLCTRDEFRCDNGVCIEGRKVCDGIPNCLDASDERSCDIPPAVPACPERTFDCGGGYCIDKGYVCDGVMHCQSGGDEANCDVRGQCDIRCGDGTCVDNSKRCDQVADCNDEADERDCGPCKENEFRCESGTCIPADRKCDSISDCVDSSDEENCPFVTVSPTTGCRPNEFRCPEKCISGEFRCDSVDDCSDGSDEIGCESDSARCGSDSVWCDGKCLDPAFICDGKQDCQDGADEAACESRPYGCSRGEYECADHSCIDYSLVCNSVAECADGSDEQECGCDPSEWQCATGDCVVSSALCNGVSDCPDGSDEQLPSCRPATEAPTTRAPYTRPSYTRPPYTPPAYTPPQYTPYTSTSSPMATHSPVTTPWNPLGSSQTGGKGLNLKTYPNEQIIRQNPYRIGGEVVFQCRDEGEVRAPVKWVREGGRPLPAGSSDINGRLEMPNIQVADSGIYICQAVGYPRFTSGSELSVRLTVEAYNRIESSRPHESCKIDEATCSSGQCIPKNSVCNGNVDCTDGSDEIACNIGGVCEPNEFKCDNKRCVLKTWLCDSEDDCKDGSDERQCDQGPPGAACRPHEFQCRTGRQCVPRSFHCDGEKDCLDGSDEVGCSPVYISRPPPPLMVLSEYATLSITCVAVGVPTPQVVWRLNWGHIPAKCSYTSVDGVGTLNCPNVQNEDQGAYSCEALNNRGSVFAVPDTILVINGTKTGVCPAGYFNSEARVAQDCISCFCFGATSECRSADLFTYQLPPPLNRGGSHLAGVIQQPGQPLQITDEPISDIFELSPEYNGAIISRLGQWSSRNIYPYLALPETYHGSQLLSYGGYIKYTVRPHGAHPPPSGYSPLPDIIIKGGGSLLTHSVSGSKRLKQDNNISVRLFQGQWKKETPYGPQPASREDIMMVLANIEAILLRGEESGSGVEIKNFNMDSAGVVNAGQGSASFVEECTCPHGYSGLSCQKCSPGFNRVESGRWLGKCVREEEPCQPGYYGNPSAGVACRVCPCPLTNPTNQFSRTCILDSDKQVTCNCPPGYQGRRCESCAAGYVGNPTIPGDSCRPAPSPSRCDPRGTASQDEGQCRCKPNVVGSRCNECANEAFHLSHENIFGCSQCFCMGVTRTCSSSQWRRESISVKFGSQASASSVKLLEWDGETDKTIPIPSSALRTDLAKQEISFSEFDLSKPNTFYWELPDRFIGDKLTSYGGYLNYTIRHVSGDGFAPSNNAPDVQLISKNDITLVHYNGATPGPQGYLTESVQIMEQYWQRSDGKQVDREHILMALADVEAILIKATYEAGTERAALVSASLQVASERGSGERASHVEQCQCPEGYLGTSCQDCAPGFTRGLDGLYLGFCEACSCNGHADQCHPETGDCLNCQHNTEGPSCEVCLPGYEGDATIGTPGSCRSKYEDQVQCRCDARGTKPGFCTGGSNTCSCKDNVEGERCDQCQPGSFNLEESNPWGCSECFCSGVTNQCSEASYLYRQQIPTAIFDDSHGFTLTTLNQDMVIDANFQLNVPLNQISYGFDGRSPSPRLFWSLPSTFTGNKVTSYGGQITITQKFEVANGRQEYATDDTDILLVGNALTVYWKNPNRIRSNTPLTYSVPLSESGWNTLSAGEAPRPVSRSDFLSVLADLRQVLVRAVLVPMISHTYIADVAMDTAVPSETGQPLAKNIEVCRCPFGYIGTSCESCMAGHYRSREGVCIRCPCSGNEEACNLGPSSVICHCKPGFAGSDCSSVDYGNTTQSPVVRPPVSEQTIQVVIAAPTIENKPVGGRVQFICTARSMYSSSPLRVTWSKEGGSLPLGRFIEDASRGILSIRDLKVSDSGTYICQANDGTSIAIDRATLTVPRNEVIPPQITISPAVVEVYEGEPIEMRCDVVGTPTPTLTWSRVNRRPLNYQHTFVNGVFRISSARQSDQGEYKCVASNAAGQDYKPAVVYVNPRPENPQRQPVLSVNPSSPVVKEGDSLTLVCSADPNVPANLIIWTREDGSLPSNFRSANGQLWMEQVRPEDGGVYRCSAERASQRVSPTTVLVTVQRAPRPPQIPGSVTIDKTRSTVPEGQSLTIKCEPRGSPLPIIKWTKDGSEFGPGVGQRGNALVISQSRISDRGVYVCVGSTIDGESIAQASAIVEVERREVPSVVVWPEGVQAVRLGSSVRLQCRIQRGAPEPVLTWSRPSGRTLSSNTHLLPDGILSFSSVSVNEEGVYTCTGSNIAGEGSANATIKIHSPPVLSIYPESFISVMPGKDVVVECRASGYPEPTVHWVMVLPEERPIGPENVGVATLTLSSIEEADEGTYACVARNEAGIQEEKVLITVQDNDIDSEPVRGDISGPVSSKVYISANSKNVSARIGDSLRIDCIGTSTNQNIVWSKSNTRQYLETEAYSGGSTLVFNNLGPQDSGTYRCEGIDRNGDRASADEFTLFVMQEIVANYNPAALPPRSSIGEQRPPQGEPRYPNREQDWQQNPPEVYSARLGSPVSMPCITDLPPPVTFQWDRPHASLPRSVQARSPTLHLASVTENDAGPYICRVSNKNTKMESRVILTVTHVVPRFSGDGFIALNKLKDTYFHFDIEIVVKPQDYNGVILYNSEKAGPNGDMVSLSLVNGIPEFRYILGLGSAVVIRGDKPLSLDTWHKIKITRNRKDGYMYVDGQGPFSGSSTSKHQGLDLSEPLYIGGVPDYNQLPEDFQPRTGFVGCVGKLVLESTEVALMREALENNNAENCDSCSATPCQNNAVCQEALTDRGYSCLCPDGYSGPDCNRTGETCRPGLCGQGQCKDLEDGYTCICPIEYAGERCESRIEIAYPAFGGTSYLAFDTPKTSFHLKMSLKVKPNEPVKDGIILYCAESRHGHGDFTSLTLKNGHLEFRFDSGSGPVILKSHKPLRGNEWVNVNVSRVMNHGKLEIEGHEAVTGSVRGKRVLNLMTPLYVGGYDSDSLTINKGTGVETGFNGCISDVKISDVVLDILSSPIKSANIRECGANETNNEQYRPHRGDIPEASTPYPTEAEGVCRWCQNGGYCAQPGDTRCMCRAGFRGTYCEVSSPTPPQTSPCELLPCENGGTCRPTRQGSLYKCDCPLGTGGFQCRQRVEIREDLALTGEGYVELPASLLPHEDTRVTEYIALAFTTSAPDGLLVLQSEQGANFKDGDFIMLSVTGGFVELQWELGGGVGTIQNTRIQVSDNQRHQVVVKRTASEATLEVDGTEDHGKAPGLTQNLNADSNIYVGGIPSNMTNSGLIGFTGCIHQIEFQDSRAVNFGALAIASRNANSCST